MRILVLWFSLFLVFCTGCSTTASELGSDRDAKGCIASAGYSWCVATQKCERPGELAKKQAFENTQADFDQYCNNPGL